MLPRIGYAIREQNRAILADDAIDGVEITFERADEPLRVERYVGDLEVDYVSVHALKLSLASPDRPERRYTEALRAIALENGAQSVSDHLGFTRDAQGGAEIGHFAPPPFVAAALDATSRNIDHVRRELSGLDFFVENIAYLFQFRAEMDEADFLARLLDRTGCGWLLDVTNVYANALNHGYDASEFIRAVLPHAATAQIHLAGGFYDEQAGLYIDSHSHPIPEPVWRLYREALELGRDKFHAVFIERDQNFPDATGWRAEVRQARTIAEEVFLNRETQSLPHRKAASASVFSSARPSV